MAATGSSNYSMDDLMKAGFWSGQRNRIIGLVVVVGVVVAAVLFFRQQGRAKEAAGWEALVEEGRLTEHPDLGGAVEGTSAEPWALWQSARSAWGHEEYEDAERFVAELIERFPEHSIATSEAPAFLADIRKEISWKGEHAGKKGNPDVPAGQRVTLKTSLGDIEVGLYPEQAPNAVREFLGLIRDGGSLAQAAFVEGTEGFQIVLAAPAAADENGAEDEEGADEDAAEEDAAEDEEDAETTEEGEGEGDDAEAEASDLVKGIVPDRNPLSHYEGAVSFVRRFAVEDDATPQVGIYLADNGGLDSRQVVFGQVMSGLELLKEAAKRERDESGTAFKEPLAVDAFVEGADLAEIQ